MTCKCGSQRLMSVSAKCSDCFALSTDEINYDGYVPRDLGIGGGDYLSFTVCLDCGQIQGWKPVNDEDLQESLEDHGWKRA